MLVLSCSNLPRTPGFAIVIDKDSYTHAKTAVDAYAFSIAEDGLEPFIIVDSVGDSNSIREQLMQYYQKKEHPLEGAVFIGDIPVPMILDAQHFTRAFKMDQDRFSWEQSSVPSDRFYDDFDLRFEFLKKDSIHPNLHYYSLKPESSQYLAPEIYTGRIKPFETDHKYEDLKKYLTKVVRLKKEKNVLDEVLFFAGHGYNSESMLARMDEKIALYEQFPWLKKQQNGLEYIDFSFDKHIRQRLMSELQRNDLDMALLHHHGNKDVQYLNGLPDAKGITQQVEGIKLFLRSKLRIAKQKGQNTEKVKQSYHQRHGVPLDWFEGTFDENQIRIDSINYAKMDVTLADMEGYVPNARFIMFDSCFNGAFQLGEYLSGAYIFGEGNTIVVHANSVSTLQDKWPDEHIIGDPTFHFSSVMAPFNLNEALADKDLDIDFWKNQLNASYPDIQALALLKLYENNYPEISDLLFNTFQNSTQEVVRMESLKLLTALNDKNFKKALVLAIQDSYELIRREALYLIGKCGDEELVAPLVTAAVANNTSIRESFNIKQSLQLFPKEAIMNAFDTIYQKTTNYIHSDKVKPEIKRKLEKNTGRWDKSVTEILNPDSSNKKVKFAIRSLRNYNYHPGVPDFCKFLKDSKNPKQQVLMLEALGWFNLSYQKPQIIDCCTAIIEDKSYPEKVRKEALKSKNRLLAPWSR
ncbi:MAG: hypothetical protein CR989_01635 [Flavobacteriales bacterium]|nr:MAG: hypothetical protein CR989_01635 [Flavobacteriales bacterium]